MSGAVSLRSERHRYLCLASGLVSPCRAPAPRAGLPGRPDARPRYLYGLQKGLSSCIKILRRDTRPGRCRLMTWRRRRERPREGAARRHQSLVQAGATPGDSCTAGPPGRRRRFRLRGVSDRLSPDRPPSEPEASATTTAPPLSELPTHPLPILRKSGRARESSPGADTAHTVIAPDSEVPVVVVQTSVWRGMLHAGRPRRSVRPTRFKGSPADARSVKGEYPRRINEIRNEDQGLTSKCRWNG